MDDTNYRDRRYTHKVTDDTLKDSFVRRVITPQTIPQIHSSEEFLTQQTIPSKHIRPKSIYSTDDTELIRETHIKVQQTHTHSTPNQH